MMVKKQLNDILTANIIGVSPVTSVAEAIKIMGKENISCVIIWEEEKPLGIFTERNIVKLAVHQEIDFYHLEISKLMTSPVLTASRDMDIYSAYHLLATHEIRHLVIVDGENRAVGLVTQSDMINHLGYEFFVNIKKISQIMNKSLKTASPEDLVFQIISEMAEKAISCIVIVQDERPVGILTERDVGHLIIGNRDFGQLKLGEVMSQPVQTVTLNTSVHEAINIMKDQKIRRLVVVNKAGEVIGLTTQSDLVRGMEGKYIAILKEIIREKEDILDDTLRNLAEKTVYLDNILQSSIDMGIVATDISYRIVYYNLAAQAIMGYRAEEVVGRSVREIHTLKNISSSRFDRAIELVKKHRRHFFIYEPVINGRKLYIQARVSGIWDNDQKLIGYVMTLSDSTERKRAEEALRESEEKYRVLMDNAGDGILLANTKGKLLEANKKMLELLGYSREDLLKLRVDEIHPSGDRERTETAFQNIVKRGEGSLNNEWILRKDGEKIPVDINSSLVEYAGKKVVQGIYRETSERRKMQEEQLRITRLESLSLLAGGIAHDFNNLLTAILGNVNLVRLEPTTTPEMQEILHKAESACLQTKGLAKRLLTFAKGGAPVKKPISLAALLQDASNLFLCGSKNHCQVFIADDLGLVEADEDQINQAITNLMINADQAMPEGGLIQLRADNVEVPQKADLTRPEEQYNLLPPGKYIKITITDQGMGIPADYFEKIFDPYFTTKSQGSGLGLATVYSIIKNHGGYITLESEVGRGSSFYIYLPATTKKIALHKENTATPARGQGRILIMDDEEPVRDVLEKMLQKIGYEVTCVKDGDEAMAIYRKARESGQPFAGVIFDLTIAGGMGGKETLTNLLTIDPQIRAIVSSGYSDDPVMADFQKYGFKGVIEKPYRLVDLSNVVHRVIYGKIREGGAV